MVGIFLEAWLGRDDCHSHCAPFVTWCAVGPSGSLVSSEGLLPTRGSCLQSTVPPEFS